MAGITLQKILEKLYLRCGLTKGESKFIRRNYAWLVFRLKVEKWDHDTYFITTAAYDNGFAFVGSRETPYHVKIKVRGNTIKSAKYQVSGYRHDWMDFV